MCDDRSVRRTGWHDVLALAALLLIPAGAVQAQTAPDYQDNAAVSERFPEPDVQFGSPAFTKDELAFTVYDEMTAFIEGLRQRSDSMQIVELGKSQQGRLISALVFTESGTDSELDDPTRPTVMMIGQQHGNEHAGGEAMLVAAERLAVGELASLLDRINVVIIPRANPDGAEIDDRVTENGVDVNRDHTLNRIPEGQAIGKAFQLFQPQVAFDAHEYSVAGRWPKAFGGVQLPDAMIQYATTGNLSPHLTELQESVFRQPLIEAFEEAGLTMDWYYTTNSDGSSQVLRMGGIGADTGRNVSGLRGAVSFLMETRGIGLGTQHFKRRVYTQLVGIETFLNIAANNAALVLEASETARAEVAAREPGTPFVITAKQTPERREIVFIDPESGKDLPWEVDWQSSLTIEPTLTRPRPAAYVLGPGNAEAATYLTRLGVEVMPLDKAATLDGSAYSIVELAEGAKEDVRGVDAGAGEIVKGTFELAPQQIEIPAGSVLVPMNQPLANLAGIVLEPESPVGYVANRIIPVGGDTIADFYRIESGDELQALTEAE